MKALALWAAKNAFIAIMICLGIIAAGGYAAKNLAIDAVPDVTNIQVQVVSRAAALSATEVESQITQPIERGMAGVRVGADRKCAYPVFACERHAGRADRRGDDEGHLLLQRE